MLIYFLTFSGKREPQFNTDFAFRYYFEFNPFTGERLIEMWSVETLGM